MIIRSQYHGTCRSCGGKIRPGDRIEWARGAKPAHADCQAAAAEQQAAPVEAPQQTLVGELITRCERERNAALSDAQALRTAIGERDVLIAQLHEKLATSESVRLAQAGHIQELFAAINASAAPAAIHAEESGQVEGCDDPSLLGPDDDCPI